MVRRSVVECSFLIPVHRDANLSDGWLHSSEAWEWLDDRLFELFGGRTLAPGLHQGFYQDPDTGEKVTDTSYKYTVALSRSRLKQLRTLLSEACEVFAQKSIYLSVAGQVEFIEARGHESG